MPRNPSGSFSPKRRTRRSGSSTPKPRPSRARRAPAATKRRSAKAPQPATPPPVVPPKATTPEPPPAPTPAAPRTPRRYEPSNASLWGLVALFVLIHVAIDRLLGLGPGGILAFPGGRLLEIFIFWVPILFLAAYLSLGRAKAISFPKRLALLLGYAFVLAILGAIVTPPDVNPPDCRTQPNAALCIAAPWFDLLFRLAPIPAFIFLFANGRHHWSLGQCFGLALATFTLWRGVYFSLSDLLVIASGGAVVGPTPAILFYQSFFLKSLWEVFYVLLGLFFLFQRVPGLHRPFRFGNEIQRVLQPLGAWTRRDARTDLAWGAVLFIPVAIGASLFSWLLSQGPTGSVGDDSRVFEEMTFDLVFLLAIAAGVGEELVFRGFLQSALERIIPFRGWPRAGSRVLLTGIVAAVLVGTLTALFVQLPRLVPTGSEPTISDYVANGILAGIGVGILLGILAMTIGWGGVGVAILIQGLLFGIVHSGYGDLDHVIVPLLFGILAGIIYRFFGLLAIILIHVEIDVFAFAASYRGTYSDPLNIGLSLLFLAQFAFAIIYPTMQALRWFETRRRITPVLVRS